MRSDLSTYGMGMLDGKVVGNFVGIPLGSFVGMPDGTLGTLPPPPPPERPVGMLVGILPPPDSFVDSPVGMLVGILMPPLDVVGVGVGFGMSWGCGEHAVIITAALANAVAPRAN